MTPCSTKWCCSFNVSLALPQAPKRGPEIHVYIIKLALYGRALKLEELMAIASPPMQAERYALRYVTLRVSDFSMHCQEHRPIFWHHVDA